MAISSYLEALQQSYQRVGDQSSGLIGITVRDAFGPLAGLVSMVPLSRRSDALVWCVGIIVHQL